MTLTCFPLQIHLLELLSPDELEARGVSWELLDVLPLFSRTRWTPQVVLMLWCPRLPLVSFPSALPRHLLSSASAPVLSPASGPPSCLRASGPAVFLAGWVLQSAESPAHAHHLQVSFQVLLLRQGSSDVPPDVTVFVPVV